jgi:hypothetical protein
MSTWISDEKGVWHPAKERVPLYNRSDKTITIEQTSNDGKKFSMDVPPGASYIYEGPDRAAMLQWWEENGKPTAEQMQDKINGNVTFGDDFKKNNEFMEQYAKFRSMFGFKDVDEYLKYIGYDQKALHEKFLKKASIVATHDAPAKVNEIQMVGGGTDRANPGKNIRMGGFGDFPTV